MRRLAPIRVSHRFGARRHCGSVSNPTQPPPPPPPFVARDATTTEGSGSKYVALKPSTSPFRGPSVYFPTTVLDNPSASLPNGVELVPKEELGRALPLFKITSPTCEYFSMRIPMIKAGLRRVNEVASPLDCNVLWGKSMPLSLHVGAEGHLASAGGRVQTASGRRIDPERLAYLIHSRPQHRFQKLNHFPGSHINMGCKTGLAVNVAEAKMAAHEGCEGAWDLMPATWSLPDETDRLLAEAAANPSKRYIWKPARGSCGRGIFIVDGADLEATVNLWKEQQPSNSALTGKGEAGKADAGGGAPARARRGVVVQEYLEDPLLVDGKKCDLRLYVGVTSFDPLVVYLHRDGLVRFAAESYQADTAAYPNADPSTVEPTPEEVAQNKFRPPGTPATFEGLPGGKSSYRYGHLTNYSIGRRHRDHAATHNPLVRSASDAAGEQQPQASVEDAGPLKWNLPQLDEALRGRGSLSTNASFDVDTMWRDIDKLIASTLVSVQPKLRAAAAQDPFAPLFADSYFELLGFDVMIDKHGKPWLIEINTLPSLESSSTMDYHIKSNVMTDLMNLIQVPVFDRNDQTFVDSGFAPMGASTSANGIVRSRDEARVALTEEERSVDVFHRLQDEDRDRGAFRRVFPTNDMVASLAPVLGHPPQQDALLWGQL